MERTDGIEHHLAVMVGINKNAFAVFIVTDVQDASSFYIMADDQHICGTEARRCDVAVIHPLFHKDQRLTAVSLHLLDNADHELVVGIGALLQLLRVEFFRLRSSHPLMQILFHLVLADTVGKGAFLRIHRGFVREVLLLCSIPLYPRQHFTIRPCFLWISRHILSPNRITSDCDIDIVNARIFCVGD